MADLKLQNNYSVSDSEAQVITCLILFESFNTAPLLKFSSLSLVKYKCPAALLFDSGFDRYYTSECKTDTISLVTNLTPEFGCVAQQSKNYFNYSSKFSVPFDWRDAMDIIVADIVGSTDLAYHSNVPTKS